MLEVLNELVPSESLAINIACVHTPYALSAVTLPENHATPEQLSLLGKYAHQSPFATYYLATLDANWKMATDFMPLEDFHHTDLYRKVLSPLGVNFQIFGMLGVLGATGYAIALNRTHHEFSERDRAVLNTIHPHLVNSFFNAAVHTRTQNSLQETRAAMDAAPGAYAYFDAEGRVAWLQKRAEEWLQEFFPAETISAENIPASIRERLNQSSRENGSPQQLEKDGVDERLLICIGASVLGGWIMRLERKPKTLPPHFRPLPQFSRRKNEVLKWMVEGKRNEEIGAILRLSRRTVENHVAEILKQLMVENRATAIVRAMEYCAAVNHAHPRGSA